MKIYHQILIIENSIDQTSVERNDIKNTGKKVKKICKYGDLVGLVNTCQHRGYKKTDLPLCKNHFMSIIKNILRKEFVNTYRLCDAAFSSMDQNQSGTVDSKKFCSNLACKRAVNSFNIKYCLRGFKITPEDIETYTSTSCLFKDNCTISYKDFKQNFFPKQCINPGEDEFGDDSTV